MKIAPVAYVFLALALVAAPVVAQDASTSPSSQAFKDAGKKMHVDMMIVYTGNADSDFVRGMIPHHQGAVDMAKVELQYGSDAQLKAMAKAIVDSQTKEIALMKDWLKSHGQTPAH